MTYTYNIQQKNVPLSFFLFLSLMIATEGRNHVLPPKEATLSIAALPTSHMRYLLIAGMV